MSTAQPYQRVRTLVYIGVFGSLWGVSEVTLGGYLKALQVPESGTLMAAAAVVVMIVARGFVPQRGSTLAIGGVVAVLKAFSIGGVVLNPMVAILAQAALAEIVLSLFPARRLTWLSAALAGAAALMWNLIHRFVTLGILGGWGMREVYDLIVEGIQRTFGFASLSATAIVGGYALYLAVIGIAAGTLGMLLSREIKHRRHQESV